jgi:hypothetical protein
MDKNVWYSVEDKLPELDKFGESVDVLVIERKWGFSQGRTDTDGYRLAYWDGKHWSDDRSGDIEDNPDYFSVVYWMYIPDTPDKK